MLVLGALEATFSIEVNSSFIRTYHNVTADALTRESRGEIESLFHRNGLERVDLHERWREWLKKGLDMRAKRKPHKFLKLKAPMDKEQEFKDYLAGKFD